MSDSWSNIQTSSSYFIWELGENTRNESTLSWLLAHPWYCTVYGSQQNYQNYYAHLACGSCSFIVSVWVWAPGSSLSCATQSALQIFHKFLV